MNKERNYHNQYQLSKKKGDTRTTTQIEMMFYQLGDKFDIIYCGK